MALIEEQQELYKKYVLNEHACTLEKHEFGICGVAHNKREIQGKNISA
jgi:hypothetical protein